jgi:hypothetical protein
MSDQKKREVVGTFCNPVETMVISAVHEAIDGLDPSKTRLV